MKWDEEWFAENLGWPFGPGSGPPRGRRSGRGRRGGRWKWFGRGDLKFAILALIGEKPMHGYEVMQALEEESKGCYKASAGSIYPTLQLLEDQGLLRSQESDGKKIYSITDEGRAFLDDHQEQVDDIFARAEKFSDRVFGHGMADLSRTFAKLSRTTFQGAVGWLEDDELLNDMKSVLNRAAREMEEAWEAASSRRHPGKKHRGKRDDSEDASADNPQSQMGEDPPGTTESSQNP